MISQFNAHIETGTKAKNLFTMRELDLQVPPFCVLPHAELQNLLHDQGLPYSKEGIMAVLIPENWIDEIDALLPQVSSYAVRSSTALEDGAQLSYAGQFCSLLNVQNNQLKSAIKQVWQSPFEAHVAAYQTHTDISTSIPISIIIQECVSAEVSGVAFSCDPLNPDTETMLINSVYGLGEGLVSGQLEADQYWVRNAEISKTEIATKTEKLIYHSSGNLQKVTVEESLIHSSSLSDSQCLELAKITKELEAHFGCAQDLEFCYAKQQLYILQSRPITALRPQTENYLVWDNSNIVESYPGITLPLTFSFISPVYAAVYKQFTAILGINPQTILDNEYTFNNMLGLLNGRVYYNLYSWYKLLSLLPGFSLNAEFMEKMMGVSERFELKDYQKPNSILEKLRVAKLAVSMLSSAFRLPGMRHQFLKKLNVVIDAHQKLNIMQMDAFACMHAYYRFEHTLSKEWKAPLLNDFFAMIWYGLFQKFSQKHHTHQPGVANNFFVNSGQVITTEPAVWQQNISRLIQKDKVLSTLFKQKNETEIGEWLQQHSQHEVSLWISKYIAKWGDRCFSELKLETVTYSQNPLLFIRILKNTFENVPEKSQTAFVREEKLRAGLLKNFVFRFLKRHTISTVSARENLRFERTRAFAEVRKIFLRIGTIFYQQQIIEAERDIFYLTKEEIFAFIKGSSVDTHLKNVIAHRKEEFQQYAAEPEQAQRIRTYGIVYKNYFQTLHNDDTSLLQGIPCCPGIVRARVKVVHSPDDIYDLQGKILVTVSTDPGWVAVFPLVKGILVQRGSVLSHAAIVSREMNIPCIVGIRNITAILQTGTLVEMNGMTGEITIIRDDEKAG